MFVVKSKPIYLDSKTHKSIHLTLPCTKNNKNNLSGIVVKSTPNQNHSCFNNQPVILKNLHTNEMHSILTNKDGYYYFKNLMPGLYSLSLPNFQYEKELFVFENNQFSTISL